MKERLVSLCFAILAAVIAYALLSRPTPEPDKQLSLPTTEDTGAAGLKGVYLWLQQSNIPVTRLRTRFSDLESSDKLPATGNILLSVLPAKVTVLDKEWDGLYEWVRRGNTLIAAGNVYQYPAWNAEDDCYCALKKFISRFGWQLDKKDLDHTEEEQNDKPESLKEEINQLQARMSEHIPKDIELHASLTHPLTSGIGQIKVKAVNYLQYEYWTLSTDNEHNFSLQLLHHAHLGTPRAWLLSAGKGQIIILLHADMLGNAQLDKGENARFISNLINQGLAARSQLLIDDYHFGLSDLYDPQRFFKDSRLHWTLAWILFIWLCYVIGYSLRLAPVREKTAPVSARDTINMMTHFLARHLNKTQLRDELIRHFCEDIMRQRHFTQEQQVWKWLAAHNRIHPAELDFLHTARQNKRISLLRLTRTITHIRTLVL